MTSVEQMQYENTLVSRAALWARASASTMLGIVARAVA